MEFKVDDRLKNDYLRYIDIEYSDSNHMVNSFVLEKIDAAESILNGKVYNFNKDNLLFLLNLFDATSISNLVVYKSLIAQYLIYVSDITSATAISQITNITTSDLESVINKIGRKKKYLTKKEYIQFLTENNEKLNANDLAIFVLLWNGVRGQGYKDLRELKTEAFNYDDSTLTFNNGIIKLEEIERDVLYDAITNSTYKVYNKKVRGSRKVIDKETGEVRVLLNPGKKPVNSYELKLNSSYIIKPIKSEDDDIENEYDLKLRILNSLKFADKKYLSGISIYSSGVMFRILEENDFYDVRYTDMDKWLNKRNIKLSRAKLTELKNVMLEKLYDDKTIEVNLEGVKEIED